MNKRFFILFMMGFVVSAMMGQQIKVWSFQQCLDTAMKRNISINQSQLSSETNRINLEQSKANRFPNLMQRPAKD